MHAAKQGIPMGGVMREAMGLNTPTLPFCVLLFVIRFTLMNDHQWLFSPKGHNTG